MKDPIERQAAIDVVFSEPLYESGMKKRGADAVVPAIYEKIKSLPSAQPDLDEWCTDCKEYDSEKHYCPRYNRVIREALKDAEPHKPGKWTVYDRHTIPYQYICSECGAYHRARYDFCPSCGADMRGG